VAYSGKPSKVASWYKRSYLQCYLLGVPELFIGYHSNGILRSTEALFISDIPSKIVNQGQPWNPQVELDRGYAVLTTIRESCAEHLAQRSNTDGMSNDKVWHVKVRNKETKVQELTMQEARNLTSADDLEQRIGIVPTRVVEELRRIGQVTS
jgi:RAT1-interacting protein